MLAAVKSTPFMPTSTVKLPQGKVAAQTISVSDTSFPSIVLIAPPNRHRGLPEIPKSIPETVTRVRAPHTPIEGLIPVIVGFES